MTGMGGVLAAAGCAGVVWIPAFAGMTGWGRADAGGSEFWIPAGGATPGFWIPAYAGMTG